MAKAPWCSDRKKRWADPPAAWPASHPPSSTDEAPRIAQHAQVDEAGADMGRLAAVVDDEAAHVPVADAGQRRAQPGLAGVAACAFQAFDQQDRKSTRLNSSHSQISYAVF